jgi:ribosomal protein S18 acetylase RimI-like enzyme
MTQDSDIAPIASVLATASSSPRSDKQSNAAEYVFNAMNWKHHLEMLWAKADIEALLRRRMLAIQLGQQGYNNMIHRLEHDMTAISDHQDAVYTEQDLLTIFWYHSDILRAMIGKCGSETSEDNIWIHHTNIALTPLSWNWLHHVQLTATIYNEKSNQEIVVGFVEVAMLSNPLLSSTVPSSESNNSTYLYYDETEINYPGNNCVVYIEPYTTKVGDNRTSRAYSPAITNLATSPHYRRMGIARQLLQFAERYCSVYWRTQSTNVNEIGLYVEKTNLPAFNLYSSLGYKVRASSPGRGRIGEMWYMTKAIRKKKR